MDNEKYLLSPYTCIQAAKRTFFISFDFLFPDHGKIIKTVNAESADSNKKVSSVVIEELDVLPTNEPIRNLEIIRTTQYGRFFHRTHDKKRTENATSACQEHTGNGRTQQQLL